jgi:uncharacterized membrane protein
LTMLPTFGVSNHITAVFEVPLMVGVKVALWLGFNDTLPGDRLMLTGGGAFGVNTMEDTAVLVGSAWLMAVSVTIC